MLFQFLDKKNACEGIYVDRSIHKEYNLDGLTSTWEYHPKLNGKTDLEIANLYVQGRSLEEVCPENLKENFSELKNKFKSYKKTFKTSKINMENFCLYSINTLYSSYF